MKTRILAGCMAFTMLSACTSEKIEMGTLSEQHERQEKNTELVLFYSGENINWIAAMEELCETFMNENPDITLQMEYSGEGEYTEELKAKEAEGEFPDVFEINNVDMFQNADKLGNLGEEISSLVENPINVGGETYGLPFYSTSYGIVYNKVLFKKYGISVPRTYEEFLQVCERLKVEGIAPLAVGGNEHSADMGWMNYFFLTEVEKNNQNWQDKRSQGMVSFQDEDMKKALEDFQNLMVGDYILEDSINMGDNQIINHMINQEVAMYYGTPAMLAKIIDAYPRAVESDKTNTGEEIKNDTVQLRAGWFYLPDKEGNSVVIEKIGSIWSVSKECMEDKKKKEAAETFLEFCYRKENYRKVLQAMYAIPVTKSAVLYAAPTVQQGVLIDYRYAERSDEFLGNFNMPESFQEDMTKIFESVAMNTMSVETASELLNESWDKAIEGQK